MGMLLRRHKEYTHVSADKDKDKDKDKNKQGAADKVAPEVKSAEAKETGKFTVTAINNMSGSKLRKLAASNGIENPEELTVSELKKVLREKLTVESELN